MVKIKYPLLFFVILFVIVCYAAKCYSLVKVKPNTNHIETDIVINFILPMHQNSLASKITVTPEIPETSVSYKVEWLNPTTMVLKLEQRGGPKGQLLTFQIDSAPTRIFLLKKSVSGKVRPQVSIELLSTDLEKVPSRGPVPIIFNTQIEPKSMEKFAELPVPGQLRPFQFSVKDKSYTDFSRWQYTPDIALEKNKSYRITFKPGLCSMAKYVMEEKQEITFTTAIQPRVISTNPDKNESNVKLYRPIEILLDQEISSASIKVTDPGEIITIAGDTEIKERKVIFKPSHAFLPGKSYKVKLSLESKDHEPLDNYQFSFSTVEMSNKYWVDVKLGKIHTLTVYIGSNPIRHMVASGGLPNTPSPIGYFYTQDRGHSFWSSRFGEGATYWVRLVGQVLVHSVPKDNNWKTKEEEHDKLGLPASHGCIRLDEKEAKWFFENIPRDTLVIIHQ